MKLALEPVQCRANIIAFAAPVVVFARAQPRPAKIEAQHRETQTIASAFIA